MNTLFDIESLINNIKEAAIKDGLASGFIIGSTRKQVDDDACYITPIRNTGSMIVGGVVVYKEREAMDVATRIDGKVDYVLVDAEKKIPPSKSDYGDVPNIERRVREKIKHSTLWVYKGNDVTVEAVDALLGYLFKDDLRGIGNQKIAILGAGNLGAKLALKLLERGADVTITRRNAEQLEKISEALNLIKSQYTLARVGWTTDNFRAAKNADILIGATNGIPIITEEMIESLPPKGIIVDVGKGTLSLSAIKKAEKSKRSIYRLDVTSALCGLIKTLSMTDEILSKRMGRRKIGDLTIVAGGILAHDGEVVVDSVISPRYVYGIANGRGDFDRTVSRERLEKVLKKLSIAENHFG